MIFGLIPDDVKRDLPNKPEVHFDFKHGKGHFDFSVKKTPSGFCVTITRTSGAATNPVQTDSVEVPTPPQNLNTNPPIPQATSHTPQATSHTPQATSHSPQATSPTPSQIPAAPKSTGSQVKPPPTINPGDSSNIPQFESLAENKISRVELKETATPDSQFAMSGSRISNESSPIPTAAPNANSASPLAPNQPNMQELHPNTAATHVPIKPTAPTESANPTISASVNPQARQEMDSFFRKMAGIGASDLHMSVSVPPMVRNDGKIAKLDEAGSVITPQKMQDLLTSIMPQKNIEEFNERHDTDFAYEIPGLARFRANIFMDRKGMGGVFRIIPTDILTAEDLDLSKHILDLCALSKGLVVVTGPTGSGKSTTLCAMIDYVNRNREDHIITIEDPIEFVHDNQNCLVNQREVHNHTDSFKDALRAALREDPDILLVGEMRDLETISIAIETAETGHLVFGTLHTTTAASTVDRIIDQFPADRQQQVRVMLSESLRGVIAQTLLPKKGGGRIAALEVLIVTPAISNLIREGKTFQIPSAMQTGKNLGMVMLNDALVDLCKRGLVEPKDAYIKAVDKPGFEMLLARNNMKV